MNTQKKSKSLYERILAIMADQPFFRKLFYRDKLINDLYFQRLITHTKNFGSVTWLGNPIWQNILDLWVIQETIAEVRPELLIECGTNRGGSAYFYAQLFDLLGKGRVVSIDIEKIHDLSHPRATFLIGSSVSDLIISQICQETENVQGPVMVILDSDHSETHVLKELEAYTPFVTVNSYCLVQDGVIDTLDDFAHGRPGPLPAIKKFLASNLDFVVDTDRCNRFLVTHHPSGWLKKVT